MNATIIMSKFIKNYCNKGLVKYIYIHRYNIILLQKLNLHIFTYLTNSSVVIFVCVK